MAFSTANMDTLTSHPMTAQQANAFTSPASLSFPGGTGGMTTPPSDKDGSSQANGSGQVAGAQGQQQKGVDAAVTNGNGVTPTTPAATPAAGQSVTAGIVPTLQ